MKTRSEQKRQAILTSAKQLFLNEGVVNTSMDKVAQAAQVSKRTVYNHFESKEVLVIALLSDLWHRALGVDILEQITELDIQQQLQHLLLAEIQILGEAEYLELSKVAFGHYLFNAEKLQEQAAKFQLNETALFKWLAHQQLQQTLSIDNVEQAAEQLHSLVKGQCFWPQLIGIKRNLAPREMQQLSKDTTELFLSRYFKSDS
ncbi:TetR/AcrR family transcriptional regulator [Parashewanella curva]|uniref:TetR/AcrR family transcriptional regulator n=1 Tax=Parashewanella curva TaxID=2338552 RepID=A0A3L8PVS5_9GAMM|nr:TetR/AcrR family transcriptional regulator [Parashewanella curva]RLV59441.1 TetR/AcrR family transcriptional regulator [Parashewanella curva]